MAKGVSDEAFGTIRWSGVYWEGTASLPYFGGSGERLPLTEEERGQLPPVDRLELNIQVGKKRRQPDERQRAAWRAMFERGDALWDEAMDALVAEYRRQWPRRARYYRRVCGDEQLLERMLPENVDRATMRQMVVPQMCTVEWPDPHHGTVDFSLTLLVTWFNEPLNVYVRDGRRVVEVVPMGWFMNRRNPRTDSPVFGTIRRGESGLPWAAEIEIEPFNTWAAVAVDRKEWIESERRCGSGDERSRLPFDVARGASELPIYGPANELPTSRQEAAFREATTPAAVNEVLRAVFTHYKEVAAERRQAYKGADRDAAVPQLADAEGLRDIAELRAVQVFPEEGARPVAVGFEFHGSWTGCVGFFGNDGCGVRWRGGKVERVGDPRVANPRLYERLEKPQS